MFGSSPARNVALRNYGISNQHDVNAPVFTGLLRFAVVSKGHLCRFRLMVRTMLSPSVDVWFKSSKR